RRDSGLLGHVGECAIAVVVIENVAAVLRNVKVGKAIPVVVADRHALPIAAALDPRLPRNISEGAVAIVMVERVAQRRVGIEKITLAAVHEVNVHPSIVVVIEKCAAGAGGFG